MSKIVITLVTLAGLNFSWQFCSYSTCPECCSIKIALPQSKFKLELAFVEMAVLEGRLLVEVVLPDGDVLLEEITFPLVGAVSFKGFVSVVQVGILLAYTKVESSKRKRSEIAVILYIFFFKNISQTSQKVISFSINCMGANPIL